MRNPIASFIVPVFNEEKYIKSCIDSLIVQTEPNFEIIAVDDGSTDNTFTILNSYNDSRLRIYRQENRGRVAARNKALQLSQGKYIILQDADDWSEPDRLEKQLKIAIQCKGNPIVGSAIFFHYLDNKSVRLKSFFEKDLEIRRVMRRIIFRQEFHPPTMLAERQRIFSIGGWREKFRTAGEDGDLISRLYEDRNVIFANSKKPLYHYRFNPGSVTANLKQTIPSQMFMRYCERKRRKGLPEPSDYQEYKELCNKHFFTIEFLLRTLINYTRWHLALIR